MQDRYKERLQYFRMLYAHAPNKSIEQIQQRNLEKLEEVKRYLLQALAARQQLLEQKFGPPELKIGALQKEHVAANGATGWLILHTERRKPAAFALFSGVNFLGRKKSTEAGNYIVIDDDPYVSRIHAFIKCHHTGDNLFFELYDGDGTKPSANGVFVNGHHQRVRASCVLSHGDTIQIGNTKLVLRFKNEHNTASGEMAAVLKTNYIDSVQF